MINIKLVLWGAGAIGKRFIKNINKDYVVAYIDSDEKKIGMQIEGVPVISFEDYLKKHKDAYIVLTHHVYHTALALLKKHGIEKIFFCTDCPGEWADECDRKEFKKLVNLKIKKSGNGVVYGCNLYGLHLANIVKKHTNDYPVVAYNDETDISLINNIKKDIPCVKFVKFDDLDNSSIVYIAEDRRKGFDTEDLLNSASIIECWDCVDEIPKYHNKKLKRFYNSHKNESCFIIGNGPSLRVDDLNTLNRNSVDCFGVNEIYYLFDKTEWRPQYYVVGDTKTLEVSLENIEKIKTENIFFSDQLGSEYNSKLLHMLGDGYYRYHIHRANDMNLLPRFSEDLSKVAYYGATVTYICIQFAVYMGYKNIYLTGVDSTGSSKYQEDNNKAYSHFYSEKELTAVFTEPYMTHAYMAARNYAESHGINIYNATRGGELEVFERVDFDCLFN